MSTTATLSSEEVKRRILALQTEFEQVRKQADEADRKGREIDQQICALQAQCPHEHTRQYSVLDVGEMKLQTFCTDCGARC